MMTAIAEAASLEVGFWTDLATLIVESVIVVLLYRKVKRYSEVAKQGRIEANRGLGHGLAHLLV